MIQIIFLLGLILMLVERYTYEQKENIKRMNQDKS
jgi:hypothetical protein